MWLNRERITAGLSLLILVFGVYGIVGSKFGAAHAPISLEIPGYAQEVPRLEPRLYFGDLSKDRTPYEQASDWTAVIPEGLDPPPPEPTIWIATPLEFSPDPAIVGFSYLKEPPRERKQGEAEDESQDSSGSGAGSPGTAGSSDSGSGGSGGSPPGNNQSYSPWGRW